MSLEAPQVETLVQALDRAAEITAPATPGRREAGLRVLDRRQEARWTSWHGVRQRALQVSLGLLALGIGKGERVALVYPTSAEFFDAFFGILLAGAVPVPLYPPVRLGRLGEYHRRTGELLALVEAQLVLADRRVSRLLGEAVARARPRLGCRGLAELPPRPSLGSRTGASPVGAGDLALVQFSSGTTVEPKPVALTHGAVLSQARILNGFWPDTSALRHSGASWLPLYHDMGLIGCVFPALLRPADLTLLRPEAFVSCPASWLQAISRYRATISPAPNFAYALCLSKIRDEELEGVDLSCWRVALNGAEAVTPSVLAAFVDRFSAWGLRREALTPVYGLSEASLAVTFSPLNRPFVVSSFDRETLVQQGRARPARGGLDLVSVGKPVPGFRLQICDQRGKELDPERVGRIWVKGPSLMEGYLNCSRATAEVLQDGWLDTGDQGFVYQGDLYLTGRAKDLIIQRGRNYAPEQVEGAVDGVAGVRKGCCVAVSWLPEGREQEELVLFVERSKGSRRRGKAKLIRECHRRVLRDTGLALSRTLVLGPGTLPRTSSGKLRRGETLRQFLAGELKPPRRVGPLLLALALARSYRALRPWKRVNPSSGPMDPHESQP